MNARPLHVSAALFLVPALAFADPAPQASSSGDQDQKGQSTTAPAANEPVKVPKDLASRSDFSLSLTTLDALHKKGALSDEEYNAALRDMIAAGERAAAGPTFVLGRFVTTFYGWTQGDIVHDSQRVVTDQWGGHPTLQLKNAANGAGVNGRTVMGARGTRFGFRMAAPVSSGVKVSGNVEMDFLGNAPADTGAAPRNQVLPTVNTTAPGATPVLTTGVANLSEQSFFTNATPRIRQAFVKVDTSIVSIWAGQTWNITGFQAAFFPTSVQYQGLPGQLFGRDPQLRLSRTLDAGGMSLEVAAAALRPPQIDSEIPDFQGGLKLNIDAWKGVQTLGATGTTVSPASIAVSGALRRFKFAQDLTANPKFQYSTGRLIAVDAWIPIIPAAKRGPLSVGIIAEGSMSEGATDLYTGLSGGATIGQPRGLPATATPAQIFAIQNGDNGPVGWNTKTGKLEAVNWRMGLVGVEVHTGPIILAANLSSVYSNNVQNFTGATWNRNNWWDANLLVDWAPGFRTGIEFARTLQRRVTAGTPLANESRVFFSGFFIF